MKSLRRQLHKKLILPTFQLDVPILLEARKVSCAVVYEKISSFYDRHIIFTCASGGHCYTPPMTGGLDPVPLHVP